MLLKLISGDAVHNLNMNHIMFKKGKINNEKMGRGFPFTWGLIVSSKNSKTIEPFLSIFFLLKSKITWSQILESLIKNFAFKFIEISKL